MKQCHACHHEWEGIRQPGTKETCPSCAEDLHVCLNCDFFDEHKPCQCRVPDIDPVTRKDRFNFCDEFRFSARRSETPADEAARAREQFKRLFGK